MSVPWGRGFVELADRCYLARYREWDVNVGVVVGERGAIVVDTRASTAQGRRARADVLEIPGAPSVAWVVNTHEHFDHVFGNAAFEGATIVAHENAVASIPTSEARIKRLIREDPELDPEHPEITEEVLQDVLDTEVRLPDESFSSARTIDLGDRYVELVHPGRGHTDGDLVLRVPDCDVVFAGDLIEESADRDATPGFGGDCWPLDWAPSLDLVIGLLSPATVVVPGHGTVVDRDFVEQQRDDISAVAGLIRSLAAAGVPVDAALSEGERLPRPAPLAAGVGALIEPGTLSGAGTGWPFAASYLEQAVARGYQQLGLRGE